MTHVEYSIVVGRVIFLPFTTRLAHRPTVGSYTIGGYRRRYFFCLKKEKAEQRYKYAQHAPNLLFFKNKTLPGTFFDGHLMFCFFLLVSLFFFVILINFCGHGLYDVLSYRDLAAGLDRKQIAPIATIRHVQLVSLLGKQQQKKLKNVFCLQK